VLKLFPVQALSEVIKQLVMVVWHTATTTHWPAATMT
jgi:hypothetical protein